MAISTGYTAQALTGGAPALSQASAGATWSPVASGASAPPSAMDRSANPHEVRDPATAQSYLDQIRYAVLSRFPTLESAVAAGYAPTSNVDGPQHYTIGGYTSPAPDGTDGGATDFSRPFSLMVDHGQIVGVMLRSEGDTPDLGAGEWHDHGDATGDHAQLMHVWFDRPLDQAFGGHVPGFLPNEPGPSPDPLPLPMPAPDPMPMPMPAPGPMPMPAPAPEPTPVPMPMPDPMPMPAPLPATDGCTPGCG
jgi:hypothetical protein